MAKTVGIDLGTTNCAIAYVDTSLGDEAPIVQLTGGKPTFIGWFRPAYLPPP